jgi:hypothetical protein
MQIYPHRDANEAPRETDLASSLKNLWTEAREYYYTAIYKYFTKKKF